MFLPNKINVFSRVLPNIAVIMKPWEYNFDSVSKSEWIRQIETDLKQKPFSSLQGEWWPGETLSPIVHQEDLNGSAVRLPDHFFKQPPAIAEYINAVDQPAKSVNHKILDALKQDAQTIIIRLNLLANVHYKDLFKDVLRDIVTISVEPDVVNMEAINRFLKSGESHLSLRINRNENPAALKTTLESYIKSKHPFDNISLVYYFPSEGNWDVQTALMFQYLLRDLVVWKNFGGHIDSFFNQTTLSLQTDHSYFRHIVQARVLHLLWQNLRSYFNADAKSANALYLESHVEQRKNENPDQFLIRASMSALAASLSGSHRICIHHDDTLSQTHYKRINRNIHHLLNLESNMAKGVDPLSGSYPIDLHCKRMTSKIWGMIFSEK